MSSLQSSFGNLTVNERKIIVGIDFGTTFSGLAWAERKRVRREIAKNEIKRD
jgi:molecular chaperone DnaK (HSP70)